MKPTKLEKINSAYKKGLSQVLLKLFPQQNIQVGDVLIHSSMRHGKIWLETSPELLAHVESKKKEINDEMAKHVSMRFVPKLEFLLNDDYLEHLEELFEKVDNEN